MIGPSIRESYLMIYLKGELRAGVPVGCDTYDHEDLRSQTVERSVALSPAPLRAEERFFEALVICGEPSPLP